MSLLCTSFDEMCRTCATKSPNMRNLFENGDGDETFIHKIFVCTQVHITNEMDRPSKMCGDCEFQLEQAYKFHNLVKTSEQTFQNMVISNIRMEIITEEKPDPFGIVDVKMESDQDDSVVEQLTTASVLPDLGDSNPEVKEELITTYRHSTTARNSIKVPIAKKSKKEKPKKKTVTNKKRNKDQIKTYECYKCKEEFPSFWKTSVHLKQHYAEEKFKCIVCGIRFILWDEFSRHLCQGSSISCSYCGETFYATVALINHLDLSHDEKTLFKCETCAQFYSMSLLRQYHIQIQHADVVSEESKPFECAVCKKRFGTKVSLRNHEEIHSDKKPFLCFECGKRFKTSSSLHTHRICHTEKTMKCPDCPMTFNRIAGFRKHRDVHLNLKYKCNQCHAELRSKDALERHTRRHRLTDDDKRHQCTFCPMKFFKRDKLTRHIRTHTGEKPFKCAFCSDRAYAQKGDLTKHIKLKHVGNKIYNCEICKEGFQYYADLKTHTFEHYKEDKAKQEALS